MKRLNLAALGMLVSLTSLSMGFSQQPSAITSEKIVDSVYLVKGGVANTGFVVGEKEVAAIDAMMTADSAQKMIEEIKKATTKPLTRLILTHSDGDHVNGLAGFPQGLEIVSSIQARNEMAEAFKAPGSQALQSYLPTKTFAEKLEIDLAPERIQLIYFGPAHTSGDTVVYFPARKLAFVGDLVFIGRDPLIHRQKGGTSGGLIKTLKALLDLDADQYVPGHGGIVTKSEIKALVQSLQEKQDKIRSLISEGKSLDDVKTAFGVSTAPAKPGGMRFPSLVEIMYLELTGR